MPARIWLDFDASGVIVDGSETAEVLSDELRFNFDKTSWAAARSTAVMGTIALPSTSWRNASDWAQA